MIAASREVKYNYNFIRLDQVSQDSIEKPVRNKKFPKSGAVPPLYQRVLLQQMSLEMEKRLWEGAAA